MTNEKRIEIEQRIVRKYVKALLDAGYSVAGMNIDGEHAEYPGDLFAGDEAFVSVVKEGEKPSFLYFVYGNEPGEVLNDYGVSLEAVIAPINQYAEQWA